MSGPGFLSPKPERVVGSATGDASLALATPRLRWSGGRPLTQARAWLTRSLRPELVVLLAVAAFLNLWDLSRNGWANGYYAAAVRSMISSWHNFLYGSFDPSGVMTVDKPPLAFWVQALSAKLFGFNSWSVLVPEALMGVVTVALTYDLVSRRFGRVGGFVAGLTLAITPITVAMSRHNNPDAAVILCCVAALWFAVRAFEDGRTKWILWCGVMLGLGFEAKMSTALLVVPGITVAWLWASPNSVCKSVRQLLAGGAAMVAVGGAWPLLVALTPAADRPWIAGTADNSIWSLITNYNGVGRIAGQSGGPAGTGGFGGGGSTFGGSSVVLRLLNSALGGQAGWLLGFALVSGIGVLAATRLRRRDPDTGWILAVGGAALTSAAVFSIAQGIFHPYYVSLLAPFSAALIGAGAARIVRGGLLARAMAPLAIGAGVATELAVMHSEDSYRWLEPIVITVAIAAAVALVLLRRRRLRLIAVSAALATLSIAPAAWAVDTLGHATSSTFPSGGPANAGGGFGGPGGRGGFGGPGGRGGFGGPGGRGGFPGGRAFRGGASNATASSGGIAGLFGGSNSAGAATTRGASGRRGGLPDGGLFGRGAGVAGGGGGFAGGGSGFGGGQSLTSTLSYIRAHGGGTLAISSQTSAETAVINHGAHVAGIGGFSGNESEVSAGWLAQEVRSGKVRWVLDDSAGGFGGGFGGISGGRVGSRDAMQWVSEACRRATTSGGSVLYDCSGRAARILAVAGKSG
ncbi:MAG TPA: glycosyltransferase family 39 protein [Solirubrobacteraceae bacterium]|nr:glycosyltransferase family 39 protein [Solirubrobacteraceae bacterium]